MRTYIIRWAFVLCAFALPISSLLAQLPTPPPTPTPPPIVAQSPPTPFQPPYAIVTYSSSQSVTAPGQDGRFSLVGLQPDEVVQVTVQYPTDQVLQIVNLEALDGGTVLPPTFVVNPPAPNGPPTKLQPQQTSLSLVVSADGTLSFTFQAAHNPGKNQISLRQGSQEMGLQFWVLDPQNPQNNPSALTANNPNT